MRSGFRFGSTKDMCFFEITLTKSAGENKIKRM